MQQEGVEWLAPPAGPAPRSGLAARLPGDRPLGGPGPAGPGGDAAMAHAKPRGDSSTSGRSLSISSVGSASVSSVSGFSGTDVSGTEASESESDVARRLSSRASSAAPPPATTWSLPAPCPLLGLGLGHYRSPPPEPEDLALLVRAPPRRHPAPPERKLRAQRASAPAGLRPPPRQLPGAAFYGPLDARNPLLLTFQKEIRHLRRFLRGRGQRGPAPARACPTLQHRGASTLFNIWKKYETRLPPDYYNEQLLKVGDSLVQMQEYKLALLQCYGRYLSQFTDTVDHTGNFVEEREMNIDQFKSIFFPNGLEDKNSSLTFHALEGKCTCLYQMICAKDAHLQNEISVNQCFNILYSMRLLMQVALPQERLCWIIYNGTGMAEKEGFPLQKQNADLLTLLQATLLITCMILF
ncbi:uncharacterized protein LOC141512252 [Macrotis lagotis]|uniref:uncharacterized protein LOC141512252 n=1 Tax=Macrotis lagotis TaxID=92651 RepID=UPI003D680B91